MCKVIFARGEEFEVTDDVGLTTVLNLSKWTCVCRGWQMSRLPCKHAAVAIANKRYDSEQYCDSSYSKDT